MSPQRKGPNRATYWSEHEEQTSILKAMFYAYYTPRETYHYMTKQKEENNPVFLEIPAYEQVQYFFQSLKMTNYPRMNRENAIKDHIQQFSQF